MSSYPNTPHDYTYDLFAVGIDGVDKIEPMTPLSNVATSGASTPLVGYNNHANGNGNVQRNAHGLQDLDGTGHQGGVTGQPANGQWNGTMMRADPSQHGYPMPPIHAHGLQDLDQTGHHGGVTGQPANNQWIGTMMRSDQQQQGYPIQQGTNVTGHPSGQLNGAMVSYQNYGYYGQGPQDSNSAWTGGQMGPNGTDAMMPYQHHGNSSSSYLFFNNTQAEMYYAPPPNTVPLQFVDNIVATMTGSHDRNIEKITEAFVKGQETQKASAEVLSKALDFLNARSTTASNQVAPSVAVDVGAGAPSTSNASSSLAVAAVAKASKDPRLRMEYRNTKYIIGRKINEVNGIYTNVICAKDECKHLIFNTRDELKHHFIATHINTN